MPQLQSVVLTDRATPTPVDHTFVPRDVRADVGTVIETTGVPVGNPRLSVSLRVQPSGQYKPEVKLAVPVVMNETINGVTNPKVVRTAYADVTFKFDPLSSEQERADLVGMLVSALSADKPLINDTVVKLQGVY